MARNPKDVLVSFYFFHKSIPGDEYEGTIEDLFENYVKGHNAYEAWWNHVNKFTSLENVHIVHYEDMQEDPIGEVKLLAKYLGKELSEEQIKSVVDFCSFDKLKNSPAFEVKARPSDFAKSVMGLSLNDNDNDTKGKKADEENKEKEEVKELKIFRKGKVGDWMNYFSDDMSKRLDEVVAAKLTYKKPFKYELTEDSKKESS